MGLSQALGTSIDERNEFAPFCTRILINGSETHCFFSTILSSCRSFETHPRLETTPKELVHHRVSRQLTLLLISIRVSLFYLIGLFDLWDGIRTLAISAGGTYAITAYIKGPYMPWIGFVFLMGHMSLNHIYRQILDDPGMVDITGESI